MVTPEEARAKAANTYNAASDHFDDPANSFWDRFGQRTVERLRLTPGSEVLDVCCGSGASAIPAAKAVGPHGSVLAVDLAENLLQLARAKAERDGLKQVEFRAGDLLDLGLPDASFDAVICVFGIFFIPDMTAAVRELWRMVRPSGQLAITTWGTRFFEPLNTAFWSCVKEVRPDLYKNFNPWDRVCEPESLHSLLTSAGITSAEVVAEEGEHKLNSAEDWWQMVLGSGYRGTIAQIEAGACEHIRQQNLDFINNSGVTSVEANVVYAIARKKANRAEVTNE